MEKVQRPRLIFRVDVDSNIGYGHFMRCLALAQGWKKAGGKPIFLTTSRSAIVKEVLNAAHIEYFRMDADSASAEDAETVHNLLEEKSGRRLVIDGYHFDNAYQNSLKKQGLYTAYIDDRSHLAKYSVDMILNQNVYAENEMYEGKISGAVDTLLGSDYALLRDEFLKEPQKPFEVQENIKKVLIVFGGGDHFSLMEKTFQALLRLEKKLEVMAVYSGPELNHHELKKILESSDHSVELMQRSHEMKQLFKSSDMVFTAGGSTCWELCYLGVPFMVTSVADNQEDIAKSLGDQGIALNLGESKELTVEGIANGFKRMIEDSELRKSMSVTGQAKVDGLGVERVCKHLMEVVDDA